MKPVSTILLVVFLAGSMFPQVSYEGQKIGAVDLVANPLWDVSGFKKLIQLSPGEAYSEQKAQASIAALKDTGRFSGVKLRLTPEPKGLRVEFVLEPAYYIGVIEFPGATGKFPYSRLLQVVNFPDQSPFDSDALPRAQADLADFFAQNGYFEPEIHADTQLDTTQRIANVVFHVDLGRKAKIGKVTINGPSPAETSELLHSLRTLRAKLTGAAVYRGKTYDPRRIRQGAALLRNHLGGENYLANKIDIAPPAYHPETKRADVTFNVTVGPKVSIQITGAKLSILPFVASHRKKKLIPVYSEHAIDRELVAEGRQNLIDYFQSKGYFDVKVNTQFARQPDQINITYAVDKGHHHKVDEVAFKGNRHVDEDELSSLVAVKKHHFLNSGRYSSKLVAKSVSNITNFYRDRGYEQVKVTPQVVDQEPNINVVFQIDEGPQTLISDLKIAGNNHLTDKDLKSSTATDLRPGAPYSPRKLANERSRIQAVYLDRGYLNSDVKLQVQRGDEPNQVDVTFAITEGQQVRVDQVLILGQKNTRRTFIAKTADIHPEAPLSQKDMLEAESKLYDAGIFDWASVGPRRPITDQTQEDTVVKVHESRQNSLTYGFGLEIQKRGGNLPTGTVAVPGLPVVGVNLSNFVSSEKTFFSPRGSIEYTRRNLRGLAETGSVAALVSRLDQRLVSSLTDPHLPGWSYKSLLSFSLERTSENPLFTARLGNASIQIEKNLDRKRTMTLQLRYTFQKTVLSDLVVPELVLPEDRNVRLSTLSASFIRDTRDKPLDAHHGYYETLDLGITPTALGSNVNFSRLVSQFANYRPLGPVVFANSIRLGLAKPFSGSRVPTSERFFAGGGTTLRGFPLNGAGPQRVVPVCSDPNNPATCTNITIPVGGNQLFILNSELRYPIPIISNLGGVVFYDGGNVYSNINFRQFVDNYTNTVGVGLRYSTPVGPVRFDIGRNLNPIPGINPFQFTITLGQAF